ncbi:MAG: GumC family protein [Bacteroidota bacterium]
MQQSGVQASRFRLKLTPRSMWSVLGYSVLAAVLAGSWVFLMKPLVFTASASFVADGKGAAQLSNAESFLASSGLMTNTSPVARYQSFLRSRAIRKVVADKSHLAERLQLKASDWDAPEDVLGKMTSVRGLDGGLIEVRVNCAGATRLRPLLGIKPVLTNDEAREYSAEICNHYVEALRSYLDKVHRENTDFIRVRRDEVGGELEHLETRLEEFQTRNGTVDPSKNAQALYEQARQLMQSKAEAEAQQASVAKSLKVSRSLLGSEDAMRVDTETTARNPLITSLSQKLADAEMALSVARASGKKSNHPEVIELQDTIASTSAQLNKVKTDIRTQIQRGANPSYDALVAKVTGAEVSLAGTTASAQRYSAALSQVQGQISSLPPLIREYTQLSLERDLKAELVASLTKQLELATIEEKMKATDKVQVLDMAEAPRHKSGPSTVRSAAMAFLLTGMLLGLYSLRRSGLFGPEALAEAADGTETRRAG